MTLPEETETALAPYRGGDESRREQRVRRDFFAVLRKAGRAIPFAEDAVAAYYCATDHRVPRAARATLMAALAYFVAPVDLIPDILAVIGFSDDVAVLASVIAVLKVHMNEDHRRRARATLADRQP